MEPLSGVSAAWPKSSSAETTSDASTSSRAVNTIGRHPDNTMQILDRIVSKEHAQVLRQPDGRYLFRDLGSLNGSFLHGERVAEHILREGDEIMLGVDLADLSGEVGRRTRCCKR